MHDGSELGVDHCRHWGGLRNRGSCRRRRSHRGRDDDVPDGVELVLVRRRRAAGAAAVSGGATNYANMMHEHVLDVGLDEVSPLVRGIDEGITMVDKILR